MNSDKTSETTPSTDTSRDTHEAGQADRQPLDTQDGDSSGSQEMDRGTSLPDRSEAYRPGSGNISLDGGSSGGKAGNEGGIEAGLSFQYALDNQKKLESQTGEIQARNAAAEKDPGRAKA